MSNAAQAMQERLDHANMVLVELIEPFCVALECNHYTGEKIHKLREHVVRARDALSQAVQQSKTWRNIVQMLAVLPTVSCEGSSGLTAAQLV
jgi:hypothetical protein